MTQQRLVEIETKLAFQEDALQTLNATVIRQEKRIEQLETTLQLLMERVRSLLLEVRDKPADEKPPHY